MYNNDNFIYTEYIMDNHKRTLIKAFSYRTAVAANLMLAAYLLSYPAGFGLKFVVLSYTIGFVSFWVQERLWNMVGWQRDGIKDTKLRSVAKTVTWRLFSLVVLFALGILLGLSSQHAVEWTVVTNVLFVVVHYCHERLWNLLDWGKHIHDDNEIN